MNSKHQSECCSEPDIGSAYVYAYAAESVPDNQILSAEQRHAFERHLENCDACQDALIFLCELIEHLKDALDPVTLSVTSIQTPGHDELIQEYHERPLQDRLAASSDSSGSMIFPLTFSYANGQVVGQFRKRAGLLFFSLLHKALDDKTFSCELCYTPLDAPDTQHTFSLDTEEEQQLGTFRELVASNTLSGILKAIKQFEIVITRKRQ